MKKICILLSLMIMLFCSGCGIYKMEPLIEGTYASYNEKSNAIFSKTKFILKEITKGEYEEANGINVFIDGVSEQRQEKRYLFIELYLYSLETEKFEQVTLTNFEYIGQTPHSYASNIYMKVNDKIYEDDYAVFNFYHFEDDRVCFTTSLREEGTGKEITYTTDLKLE